MLRPACSHGLRLLDYSPTTSIKVPPVIRVRTRANLWSWPQKVAGNSRRSAMYPMCGSPLGIQREWSATHARIDSSRGVHQRYQEKKEIADLQSPGCKLGVSHAFVNQIPQRGGIS